MLRIGRRERSYYFYLYDDSRFNGSREREIAQTLNMEIFDYRNILIKNRAIIDVFKEYASGSDFILSYFFEKKEDAQKAIEELEAYVVIEKLTE